MPSTRRRFLIGSSISVALLSGCTSFGDSTATLNELKVELVNGTNARHAFHFAVETTEGLGEWESYEVAPETRHSVVREPPEEYDPVSIHGVVDDHPIRGTLIGIDGAKTDDFCLRILFEYRLGEEPTFLESTDIRCER